jgi:hypothetical protein
MSYTLLRPPFSLDFSRMTKVELEDYYAWFQNIVPERIVELEAEVRQTRPDWTADLTPVSLAILGTWLVQQVETRPRTPDEVARLRPQMITDIAVPTVELTDRTFSLCADVGMYFSQSPQCLRKLYSRRTRPKGGRSRRQGLLTFKPSVLESDDPL